MTRKIVLAIALIVVASGCMDTSAEPVETPEDNLEQFLETQYSSNPAYESMYDLYSSEVQENYPFDEWEERMRGPFDELQEAGGSIELISIEKVNVSEEEAVLRQHYRIYSVVEASERGSSEISMVKEDGEWKLDEPHFVEIDILEDDEVYEFN